ncbi:myc box-dependent-interacting protein 1 isoform X2 [Culex quinquefasciatus]|nr:myc box-dependent-interacting protein 1 isoform X2 [Culex quinquefasciatus]
MDAINEVYEGQWTGSEALYAQTNTVEVLFQDFSHKLGDQVLIPLNTYTSQFPEMRKKIDKRGRKLVDYDSQRHSFQSLQANAAKRKDDVKVTKGRETLEEAKRTYEVLNAELHDELPALHDSRILFLVTNLQTLFASEQQFHSETSKVYAELEAIVDKLATESQRGSYTLKKITANSTPSSQPQSPVKANLSIVNNITNGSANNTNGPPSTSPSISPTPADHLRLEDDEEDTEPSYQNTDVARSAAASRSSSALAAAATVSTTPNTNNNNGIDVVAATQTQPPKTPTPPPQQPLTSSDNKVTTNGTNGHHDHSAEDSADPSSHTQNNTEKAANAAAAAEKASPPSTPPMSTKTPHQPPSSNTPPTSTGGATTVVSQSSNTNFHLHHHQNISNHHPQHLHHQYQHHAHHQQTGTGPTSLTSNSSSTTSSAAEQILLYGNVANSASSSQLTNIYHNIANNNNNSNSYCATHTGSSNNGNNNNSKLEELYDIPKGATTTDLPPGVLYRVKATYKYVREDVDELSFDVGDIVNVIEYEDPEDQEEGWLMGIKDGTNEKGMFPANFTRPM